MRHCLCNQMYALLTVLVIPAFLGVTLKDYPHGVFPRGFSKLFLKIFNSGDSDLLQQATPVPDYSMIKKPCLVSDRRGCVLTSLF